MRLPLGSMLRVIFHREPLCSCTGQLSRSHVRVVAILGLLPSSNLLAMFLAVGDRFCPSLCFNLGALSISPALCFLLAGGLVSGGAIFRPLMHLSSARYISSVSDEATPRLTAEAQRQSMLPMVDGGEFRY